MEGRGSRRRSRASRSARPSGASAPSAVTTAGEGAPEPVDGPDRPHVADGGRGSGGRARGGEARPPAMPAIGSAIRAARRRAGMPMTTLAERAGVSQPYLSQLENGRNNPSIQTLYRIANALDLSPQDLLPDDPDRVVLSRAGGPVRTTIEDRPDAAVARVLVGAPDKMIQAQEVTAEPGQYLGDWFEHDGEELVYLVEGEIEVELRSGRSERLAPGDAIWYAASTPHRWRSVGTQTARILVLNAAVPRGRYRH